MFEIEFFIIKAQNYIIMILKTIYDEKNLPNKTGSRYQY